MFKIFIIIAAVIIISIISFAVVLHIRTRNFKPTEDKLLQQEKLNKDLKPFGFAYEIQGDYFYSLIDCWQRNVGYCKLYDESAHLFSMIINCEPITFLYGGKRWLIELWKGQYGILTGAEIGIYNTSREDINDKKFQGTFYEAVSNEEMMPMSFVLRNKRRVLLKINSVHWWLAGFKPAEFSSPSSLTMDAKITFPNKEMCNAFIESLKELGYKKGEFTVFFKTVTIHYTKPYSEQPLSDKKLQKEVIQQANENNCKLFELAASRYSDTLDKLEYLKTAVPGMHKMFLDSLYKKGLYEAFEWIKDIIFQKQKPGAEQETEGEHKTEAVPKYLLYSEYDDSKTIFEESDHSSKKPGSSGRSKYVYRSGPICNKCILKPRDGQKSDNIYSPNNIKQNSYCTICDSIEPECTVFNDDD